jgi:hypothetical protein
MKIRAAAMRQIQRTAPAGQNKGRIAAKKKELTGVPATVFPRSIFPGFIPELKMTAAGPQPGQALKPSVRRSFFITT